MVDTCKTPTRVGGAEVFAAKILGSCIKKHYYRHCGPFHKVLNLLQKQKKRFQNFHLKCWICAAVHGHKHNNTFTGPVTALWYLKINFYDFTCTFTVALVQDYMRWSMMIIVLFEAKTQSFSCKTFSSAHISGCCCMVLATYLPSLLLLQCNS